MNDKSMSKQKGSRILLGIFAGIGLLFVASLLPRLIFSSSADINYCQHNVSSSFPSGDGRFVAILQYKDCSKTGVESRVLMQDPDDENSHQILVTIKHDSVADGPSPYPAPISVVWLNPSELGVYLPEKYALLQREAEAYGAVVKFIGI